MPASAKTRKKTNSSKPEDTIPQSVIPCSKRGCEIVVDALEREGVEVVFGFPGGQIIDVFDQLNRSKQFEVVLTRHEQGATHMADGYARASGRVGVVVVTSGPGATNTVTGLATAMMDSIPIVAITGQVPTPLIGNDAFQEADIVGITRSITKHSYLVQTVDELPQILKNAFHIARTGRPGPVLVDIPKDVQKGTLANYIYPDKPNVPGFRVYLHADPRKIQEAWQLIASSKKPLIYAGGGVISSNAADELFQFATRAQIPVTTTLMGLGCFPETHELALHMLGMHGTVYANKAVQECDCLIAIGSRFEDRVTGKTSEFAPQAKVIHMDIDPSSISKNFRVNIDVVGDIKNTLRAMLPMVKPRDSGVWFQQLVEWKRQYPLRYGESPEPDRIMPQYLIEMVGRMADPDAIVTTEVGQHQMWTAQYVTFTRPRSFLTSGGLGTMGYGLPASIGAQRAFPNRQVINIAGDGSIQMNIREMATAAYNNLPVKVIVVNNGWLGMVRQWQDLFYAKNYSFTNLTRPGECRDDPQPSPSAQPTPSDWENIQYLPEFEKAAQAYGWWGRKVTRKSELEDAIRECFSVKQPALLNVWVTREVNVYPMVPAGASLSQMLEGMA